MRPRRQFIAVLAAATAALAAAAPAMAVDVPVTFDYAVLDTPSTPNATVVDPSGPPVTAVASVDETTGAFTVDPATFDFPRYDFAMSGVTGNIDVVLNAPASGVATLATGAVNLNADLVAQITVDGLGRCDVDTGVLAISTENTEPLPGQRFPPGTTGVATGPGAIAVDWESLPPGTGPDPFACSIINGFVGGPGGFWLSKGIAPPTGGGEYDAAALKVRAKPARKTVKGGRAARFKVKVANRGDQATDDVSVCVKAPKGLRPAKRICRAYGTLAAGQSKSRAFTFKTKRSARTRKFRLVFRATGDDATPGKGVARLTVKKR